MAARLAILAGGGALPGLIRAEAPEAVTVGFAGEPSAEGADFVAQFPKLGAMFAYLSEAGVSQVVMAGAIAMPRLDPSEFDALMQAEAPAIMAALASGGDDASLRAAIALVERQGLTVRGAHEVAPGLTAAPGCLTKDAPDAIAEADAARGAAILTALGPLDVGQGTVVAGGRVLGIETAQGTEAMLRFVAGTDPRKRGQGGVLVKRPKPGQDLRADMPAIGPDTAAQLTQAGLSGAVISAGTTLILDRRATVAAFDAAGLFLVAAQP